MLSASQPVAVETGVANGPTLDLERSPSNTDTLLSSSSNRSHESARGILNNVFCGRQQRVQLDTF